MIPYIIAAVLLFLAAWIWNWDAGYSFWPEGCCMSLVFALVFTPPVGWVFDKIDEMGKQNQAAQTARKTAWFDSMNKAGCKTTSFVGTKNAITAVWTCPDGSAYLQPSF